MNIESFLQTLDQPWRRAGEDAWGVSFPDVGGWPLDVGLAVRRTRPALLRLQAPVCDPGQRGAADLLHRGRRMTLVRFTSTRAGEVWLQGELPWPLPDEELLSTLLALTIEAAADARYAASAARTERSRYLR